MKKSEEIKMTSNSTVYNHIRLLLEPRHCNFCGAHRGCNRHTNRSPRRNWKEYRRTQWRQDD